MFNDKQAREIFIARKYGDRSFIETTREREIAENPEMMEYLRSMGKYLTYEEAISKAPRGFIS